MANKIDDDGLLLDYDLKNLEMEEQYLYSMPDVSLTMLGWMMSHMMAQRAEPTLAEKAAGICLIKKKVKFIHKAPFMLLPNKVYFADFYIPSEKMVITVTGPMPGEVEDYFREQGITVANFSGDVCKLVEDIKNTLKGMAVKSR